MSEQLVVKIVTVDDVKKFVDLFSKAIDFLGTFLPDGNVKKFVEFLKALGKQDWLVELIVVLANAFNKDQLLIVRSDVIKALNVVPVV